MINNFKTPPYEFLSNFYPAMVMYDGEYYRTVEHAYQAAKTLDLERRKQIQSVIQPGYAKKLGKNGTLKDNWDEIKLNVMEY